jgi:DNA helicase INO80
MLRRLKADVVSEMVGKTEVMVRCPLSARQAALYRAIRWVGGWE